MLRRRRIGSVAGPAIAGLLVAFGFSIPSLFTFAGGLMLAGVAAGALLIPLYRHQVTNADRAEANL